MPVRRKKIGGSLSNQTSPYKKLKLDVEHRSHGSVAGVVLAVGQGDVGQLGLGEDILERGRPALVKIPDPIMQVCAGGMHTVTVTTQGQVYTFGCNDEGALGRDTSREGSETWPGRVDLPYKIVQVSAGDSHSAALTDDGRVYAWGTFRDANGSIGLSSEGGIRKSPVLILADVVVVKIVSGSDHLVCLSSQGELYSMGCAEQGQLGRVAQCFSTRGGRKGLDFILNPGLVRCKKHKSRKMVCFSDVWTAQYATYAQEKDSGEIYAWGLNNYYQLGFKDMENRFHPERVDVFNSGQTWLQISGGQHHTVLLDQKGKVYCLGRADYGRLGIGEDAREADVPTLVSSLAHQRCVQVGAGGCVSFAVDSQGSVYAWGMGTSRQLGTGEEEDDVYVPKQVEGKQLSDRCVVMVDAGGQHMVLLARDKNGH
ncbi:regulator of chromosome condensation-like [Gigantopelta aegis]|uniref:regulator of chromosome condensation-like n=1 Tax=Gigantopelta aegis TaxID=1735272 RepID=UPI001B88DE07|nr:regulator of chromosome condensation-like [Gigantopelta aegis]